MKEGDALENWILFLKIFDVFFLFFCVLGGGGGGERRKKKRKGGKERVKNEGKK